MLHKKWLAVIFCIFTLSAYSQIQINFPVSRIVFQRNNNNVATVNINGSYLNFLDRIEARAIPVKQGQGKELGWSPISNTLTTGIFNGSLELSGGWYNLEIRGILNNQVVANATIEKIGVGEVFIVAGQSNAQGDAKFAGGDIGATDDRVSTIDFYQNFLDETILPFRFTQMGNATRMAPYNYVPWFWGRLGDKLAQRLNVPVLFYGAALGGIGANAWQRSANGEDLTKELPTFIAVPGMPYRAMKAALQYYVPRTGVRAVLWQQGESDESTPSEKYLEYMKTVIETSRKDSGKEDLAWVMARSSRNPVEQPNVINGQNMIIVQVPHVFPGPFTDQIVGTDYRADGIHFHKEGLNMAAEYWNNALDNRILASSSPLPARASVALNVICNDNDQNGKFKIEVAGNYSKYLWSNGSTAQSIAVNSGSYSVQVHDAAGNMYFSQPVNIAEQNTVTKPVVSVMGPAIFCDSDSIVLKSSSLTGNVWNNSKTGQNLIIRNSGTYFVTSYSINGCKAVSDPVIIEAKQGPPKPVISASGAITFCEGGNVNLTAPQSLEYVWSNKTKARSINVNTSGVFYVQVKDETGCYSQPSDEVEVIVRESPPETSIAQTGPYVLATTNQGRFGSVFEWTRDGVKLSDSQSFIRVGQSGAYTVKESVIYSFANRPSLTCSSPVSKEFNFVFEPSDNFAKVFPNPVSDNLLNIESFYTLKDVRVQFYDTKGGIVRDFYVGELNPRQTLSLAGIPKGLYQVIVKNNEYKIIKRVLVQ
ncbi:sialate O-acetylesterase [Emticicia sp. 21SJ11W-3]|uniref:sialate O-acetylesterase n=1 Tax=Emticicia sp. 21SJ11W-3 TaxID=2916755 RepID=UPI00209E1053|nr:sialate O-acetylesterase [Emticicia sp. 21SJ11W-3]UTA66279.1 T9SS type A sorting domain-containing protein [Emticicia sp. 21SJ11W-3]